MASQGNKTRNPRSRKGKAGVLPATLSKNRDYLKAYEDRGIAHHDFYNAVGALTSARNKIKSHENYHKQSSDQHQGSPYTPLTPTEKDAVDTKIAQQRELLQLEHDKFVAAHQRMRDIEKGAGVETKHRLARTNMWGKCTASTV